MNAALAQPQVNRSDWSAQEAFLGILTLVAVCDGQRAAKRLCAVHDFAERSPFLTALGEKRLVQLHGDVVKRIGEAKCDAERDVLEEACANLPAEMRPSIYAACVDILGADGILNTQERELLDRLQNLLLIEPASASQIETVILLKNRF